MQLHAIGFALAAAVLDAVLAVGFPHAVSQIVVACGLDDDAGYLRDVDASGSQIAMPAIYDFLVLIDLNRRQRVEDFRILLDQIVTDQPMSRAETMAGALTRAENARAARRESDFWLGIEGGIEDTPLGMTCFAWVVVLDRDGRVGRGQTAVFFLPDEVAELVRGGMELGHADDVVFDRDNSEQANGAIGLLTDDLIDREAYYVHALIMALVPFKNPELSWLS